MKLVLHVVSAGEVGGAERMLVDLARGDAGRYAHAIALYSASPRLTAFFAGSGVTLFDRGPAREDPLSFVVRSLGRGAVRGLAGLVRATGASAVHVHTHASQVLGTRAAQAAGVPLVRTEHSTRVYDDATAWPFSRWSLARAERVVCISEHVARVARARAPFAAGAIRVVYNGIDVTARRPAPMPPASARPRFALVGRLEPRKGVDVALRALAETPGAELSIVGDGPERSAIERLTSELGLRERVEFLGYVTDVDRVVAQCHAVLSASRKEGLGLALLEGMALGRPAIAVPVGGIPEFVSPATGWLAAEASVAALAAVMREAAAAPGEVARRGAAARALVESRFSLEAMRRGYDDVYDEATARR